MEKVLNLVGTACLTLGLLGPSFAALAASKLPYGIEDGQLLTITSAKNLDTPQAEIQASHDRADAQIYCTAMNIQPAAKCVEDVVAKLPAFTFQANCQDAIFTTPRGRYRFIGLSRTTGDNTPKYQVINLNTGFDLGANGGSGYIEAMAAFHALCPSKAPADAGGQ